MTINRKSLMRRISTTMGVLLGLTLVAANSGSTPAAAEEFPNGPVKLLVAYGAGGGTDRQARLLAGPLQEILGQPVTVQNMPGGGGQVAATALLREKTDGHTILAANQPDLNMSVAFKNAPYKTTDLQVILVDLFDPRILLVKKGSPMKTFDDFVKQAKANPGKITMSASTGGAQEQFAKWLFSELKIDVRLVGYKGGSRSANAMVGGHVDSTMGDDSARFNIREKAHALLLGAPKRSPRWPEATPMAEALKAYGVTPPTEDFLGRYGVYVVPSAFKKNKPEQYAKLQKAMIKARQSPAFKELLEKRKIADLSIGKAGEGYTEAFEKGVNAIKAMTK